MSAIRSVSVAWGVFVGLTICAVAAGPNFAQAGEPLHCGATTKP